MHTMHQAEGDRVVAAVRTGVHSAEMLKLLPPGPLDPAVEAAMPAPVAASVSELTTRERRFLEARASRSMAAGDDELLASAASAETSVRRALRVLQTSADGRSMLDTVVEPSVTLDSFIEYLADLSDITASRLSKSVEQEADVAEMRFQLSQQIATAEASQKLLEEELRREHAAKETEVAELSDMEKKLRAELRDLKARAERDSVSLRDTTAANEDAAATDHDTRMERLERDFATAEQEYNKAAEDARVVEQNLRKRRNLMELDVSTKIQEYDDEMQSRQDAIDKLRQLHSKELERLDELQEHFALIDHNEALAASEAEAEAHRLEEMERSHHMMYGPPARSIQRAWRRRQQLKAEAAARKKTKGKKGKKGKKGRR